MKITSVSNPVYSKANNSTIDVIATFDNKQTHPYTAAAHDNEPHGQRLWKKLLAGDYGNIGSYVPPVSKG